MCTNRQEVEEKTERVEYVQYLVWPAGALCRSSCLSKWRFHDFSEKEAVVPRANLKTTTKKADTIPWRGNLAPSHRFYDPDHPTGLRHHPAAGEVCTSDGMWPITQWRMGIWHFHFLPQGLHLYYFHQRSVKKKKFPLVSSDWYLSNWWCC